MHNFNNKINVIAKDEEIIRNYIFTEEEENKLEELRNLLGNSKWVYKIDEVYKLWLNNYSTSDIAKRYNVTVRAIQIHLKKIGLVRDKYEAQAIAKTKRNYKEIKRRTGKSLPVFEKAPAFPKMIFVTDEAIENKDYFNILQTEGEIIITAKTIRGLIFGYSMFLRKSTFENGVITLIKNISGDYEPQKQIRGHQAGYRTTPNTYDAWDYEQYFQYYLDMMAFGSNTVEL